MESGGGGFLGAAERPGRERDWAVAVVRASAAPLGPRAAATAVGQLLYDGPAGPRRVVVRLLTVNSKLSELPLALPQERKPMGTSGDDGGDKAVVDHWRKKSRLYF